MVSMRAWNATVLLGVIISLGCLAVLADQRNDTSKAQNAYQAGVAAKTKGDYALAAREFREAIDLNHNLLKAHIGYIDAVVIEARVVVKAKNGSVDDFHRQLAPLVAMYKKWSEEDRSLEGMYRLARALSHDPETEGHSMEHILNGACATNPEVTEYLLNAVATENLDGKTTLEYARGFRVAEAKKYKETLEDITVRFSRSPAAMEALYYLAEQAATQSETVALLERVREEFGRFAHHDVSSVDGASNESPSARYNLMIRDLFGLYLETGNEKGLGLSEQMVKANPDDSAWATTFYIQRLLAEPFLPRTAKVTLEQARTQMTVLDARLAYHNHSALAEKTYESLVKRVAESPAEPLNSELHKLGAVLKKSPLQIDDDVWRAQIEGAKPLKNFENGQLERPSRKSSPRELLVSDL